MSFEMEELIKIENLGKKYRLSRDWDDAVSLKESLGSLVSNKKQKEEFWAIRHVNFSANPGDIVGVMGPNGSGKTTMLNIIAEITEPTEGKVTYRGRVGAILGANTGFHPDLNGLDNIYLATSIMGSSRKQVDQKMDEIIAFSEVGDFIHEPVKRFSSGMRMKLGISIVLTMLPEILIFDEVISVIDQEFTDKVYKKLTGESLNDRVTFIVNHNRQFMEEKCNRILDMTTFKK